MVTTKQTYTLADYLAFPDEGDLYDILGGTPVLRNVPDVNHGLVVSMLTYLLVTAQEAGYGKFFSDPHAVALDFPARGWAAQDVAHPDMFFIQRGREAIWRGNRVVEGVPDLIVEVRSPSTGGEHAPGGRLWDAYQRNGVPYYWVADPRARTVVQYELAGPPYRAGRFGAPVILREGDVLRCPLFPDLSLSLERVFRDVLYRDAAEPPAGAG